MHVALPRRSAGAATAGALLVLTAGLAALGTAPAGAVPVPPDPPVIGTATPGDTQATVTFSPPAADGGAPITSYAVASQPADVAPVDCPGSPCIVTGLTNGVSYTFTVTATNSAGTSAPSSASNSLIPRKAQTISFPNPGAQAMRTNPMLSATSSSALAVTLTSATPGVCAITAAGSLTPLEAGTCTINADQAGDADWLPAAQVQRSFAIFAVAPGAPVIGVATAGDGSATVSFSAPADDGGSVVTGYTATSSPGGLTGSCSGSPCTVSGLQNGTAYTFTVRATNTAGTGPASAASNSATPVSSDPDHDGLSNTVEAALGTDPDDADTDDDGLGDGSEHNGFTMTRSVTGCDRLRRPIGLVRTDPLEVDTDRDGLRDGLEVRGMKVRQRVVTGKDRSYVLRLLRSDPSRRDTDGDGVPDKVEDTGSANKKFGAARTDPASCHTDLDRRSDGYEIAHGTNPVRAGGF